MEDNVLQPDTIRLEYEGEEIHFQKIKEKLFGKKKDRTLVDTNAFINSEIVAKKSKYSNINSDTNVKTSRKDPSSESNILGSYCDYCDFRPKVRTPQVLKNHLKTHTHDKPFPCSVCDFSTATKHYLELHMRVHTGEKPFVCHHCHLRFSRKDSLKRHFETHDKSKMFSCTECEFKCSRKQGLYQHWKFYCKYMHFKCSVCDYKCRTAVHLKDHMLIHPKIHSCSICDYIGRCVEDLKDHNCISVKTRKLEAKNCARCGIVYKDKRCLENHYKKNKCKANTGEKLFVCHQCPLRYTERGSLNRHFKTHHSGMRA